jgi:hypothetical protein
MNLVERVFEPVEGLGHRGQQVLTGLREHERVRAPLEELHTDQLLDRNDVPRQRTLRDQQGVRRTREAAVLGNGLECAQGIERQPAPVDSDSIHRVFLARKA